MNSQLIVLFIFILTQYASGYVLFRLLGGNLAMRLNVFLISGISWCLGNLLTVLILTILASTNSLAAITVPVFLTYAGGIILCCLAYFFLDLKKIELRGTIVSSVVLLLFLVFFLPLIKDSLFSYLLAWDATAIWLLKAKAFFYAEGFKNVQLYLDTTSYLYSHKAYPVGIPFVVSAYYRLVGMVQDQYIQLYFLIYYLEIILVLFGFTRKVLPKLSTITALLGSLALLIVPNFIIYSHNGYSDVAMSFVFTVATILLILLLEEKNGFRMISYAILIGLVTGFGLTVKNEGITFFLWMNGTVVILTALRFLKNKSTLTQLKRGVIIRILVAGAIGLAPFFMWLVTSMQFKVPVDSYIDGAKLHANTVSRVSMIANYYFLDIFNVNKYSLTVIIALFVCVWESTFLIFGRKYRYFIPYMPIVLQLAVYTAIYVVTSVPLDLQLRTSFERLFMHLFPSFLVILIWQVNQTKAEIKQVVKKL